MRRALSLLLAGVTAAALAGCGIGVPEGVTVDGPGPSAGPGLASSQNETPPKWSATVLDPVRLVSDFLQAAAGDHSNPNAHTAVMTDVRKFLKDGDGWDRGAGQLKLVQVVGVPLSRDTTVDVTLRHIGTLDTYGSVTPLAQPFEKSYKFHFSPGPGGSGLVMTDPPDELLLDVRSLTRYYTRLPIYFWNEDQTSLVPDVRYMPTAVPEEQRNNRLFDWLIAGSSGWLREAVLPVPENTHRIGSIVEDAQQVTVNLEAMADEVPRDKLAAQLYWTLWPEGSQRLQLQMEGRDVETDYRFPDKNLAAAVPRGADPGRYAVVDGVLRRLRWGNDQRGVLRLENAVNRNVATAAVARDEAAFALVRNEGGGQRLYIGQANDLIARVDNLRADSMSRPIWLDRSSSIALVLADGKPWVVGARERRAVRVGTPTDQPITGLTVAPDGRRMALVTGGHLYVTVLTRGAKLNAYSVGTMHKVPTSLDGQLKEVAFMQEDTLVVTSSGEQLKWAQVTVDGAVEELFEDNRRGVATNLTAYVANAGRSMTTGSVALDLDGKANWVSGGSVAPIGDRTTPVVPPKSPEPSPSVSPSAETSPAPPVEPVLSAACFEG